MESGSDILVECGANVAIRKCAHCARRVVEVS